jgi:hypothetical protein
MNKKAQVMVIDVLFFSLCVIFIIYFELLFFESQALSVKENKEEITNLETLLFIDQMITDCNYLAYSKETYKSLCYSNILKLNILNFESELKENNICRIRLSKLPIYQKAGEIRQTLERGVVINENFEVLEFGVCK